MKGYKAYNKGLVCRGERFTEGVRVGTDWRDEKPSSVKQFNYFHDLAERLGVQHRLDQITCILENPSYTREIVEGYREENSANIKYDLDHGIDPSYCERNLRIWEAVLALMKDEFVL